MKKVSLVCLFTLCLTLGIGSAWASTGSTNPADFQDPVSWCANYPAGCNGSILSLGSPQSWTSSGGRTGMVGLISSQNFEVRQQGVTWGGDFNNGEGLIYNGVADGNTPGGILVSFDAPVLGVGAYIEQNSFGAFTGTITLLDSSLNVLGTFSAAGDSEPNPGTALFIGAFDSSADVSFAIFDTDSDDLAIATMIIKTSGTSTPEPSTLLLVGPSMLGLAGIVRRRLSRKSQEVL